MYVIPPSQGSSREGSPEEPPSYHTSSQRRSTFSPPNYQTSSQTRPRILLKSGSTTETIPKDPEILPTTTLGILDFIFGIIGVTLVLAIALAIISMPFYLVYQSYLWLTSPLGINCGGAFSCSRKPYIQKLIWELEKIPVTKVYENNEHIACFLADPDSWFPSDDAYCAYVQGTKRGATGAEVQSVMWKAKEHGCTACGSVPFGFPENNNGSMGQLVFNLRLCVCQDRKQGVCQYRPGDFL